MRLNYGHFFLATKLLFFSLIVLVLSSSANTTVHLFKEELSDEMLNWTKRCRNKELLLYEEETHFADACVMCYVYLPEFFFLAGQRLQLAPGDAVRPASLWANASRPLDEWAAINATINSVKGQQLWWQCCEAARQCCQHMMHTPPFTQQGEEQVFCQRQWDGWQCIPDTPAGSRHPVACPPYIYFSSDAPTEHCTNYGSKFCHENGTWTYKTDYRSCGLESSLTRRMYVNIGAFAFSLVFLIPAVVIFSIYKQLKVPRVTMHRHLFGALLLNGLVVIIYKAVIILPVLQEGSDANGIVGQNSAGCKIALVLTKYTRMSTYMWMFCEGFYLHKLIVTAFAEERRLLVYYIIGWVFPAFPVSLYGLMRALYADTQCWMVPDGGYEWIINAPMLLSLALNLLFLCNIIRVLITKLRATHSNEPSQYRKAVRATLVLVPLFGLHFLLTIYLPNHGACGAIEYYYYFSNCIDGLQGFVVSLIFCYLNGEVLHLLKRSYERVVEERLLSGGSGAAAGGGVSASTQMMSITEMPSACYVNHSSS